jgi:hypothetical protein
MLEDPQAFNACLARAIEAFPARGKITP